MVNGTKPWEVKPLYGRDTNDFVHF